MAAGLACSLVASLAMLANVEGDAGLRAESRTSTFAPAGLSPDTRTGWLAAGQARVALDVLALRLTGSYAPRFWTSDVEGRPSPLATQEAGARVETHHSAPWNASAELSATRGKTDPLADPWQAALATRGLLQASTLEPVAFEAARAALGASVPFDLRTTVAGRAAAWQSGGWGADARVLLPTQRGVAAELSLRHLVSVRDTIALQATAEGTTTALADADARSGWTTLSGTWRRRLSTTVDGWAGAGAAAFVEDVPVVPVRRSVFAVGEAGAAWELRRASLEVVARVVPYVDRLTAAVGPMALASCRVTSRWSPRVSLSASASAGARPNGETALASAEATARLAVRPTLALELGLVGRWQHEDRPELPSFAQAAVVAAVAWDSGPL